MGELKRPGRRGYFRVSPEKPLVLWGARVYHAYPCGTFTLDDKQYDLIFAILMRDVLPDTHGTPQEFIDMDVSTTDRVITHPLAQRILKGEEVVFSDLSFLPQSLQDSIAVEIEQGLDYYTIMLNHIYGMTSEFMGHTFSEVLERFPTILQSTVHADEEGNEHTKNNIWANSLEDV